MPRLRDPYVVTGIIFGITFLAHRIIIHLIRGDLSGRIVAIEIAVSLLSGFLFGFAFYRMARWLEKKINIELEPDEMIEFQSGANHFKGREAVGGKLVLTNKRLIFKSHPYNRQNHETTWNARDIESMSIFKNMKFLENGLILNFPDAAEKFVVHDPKRWIEKLKPYYQQKERAGKPVD